MKGKSRSWTGPEQKRLRELINDGLSYDQVAYALNRTRESVKSKCMKMRLTVDKQMHDDTLPRDWNMAYKGGYYAKHNDVCPHSRSDLYRFCAWQAGFNDRRMP